MNASTQVRDRISRFIREKIERLFRGGAASAPGSSPEEGQESEQDWLSADARPDRLNDRRPLLLNRPIKTSGYFLHRAHQAWSWITPSLLLEPLLVVLAAHYAITPLPIVFPPGTETRLEYLGWGLFIGAAFFCLGETTRRWVDSAEESIRSLNSRFNLNNWIVPLLVGGYAVLEFAMRLGPVGPMAVVLLAIVGFGAIRARLKTSKENSARIAELLRDPMRWLELRNNQNFLVALVPLIAARAGVAVLCFLTFQRGGGLSEVLPYTALGFVLLQALKPAPQHFIARCGGCARWTSRAVRNFGFCPACAPQLFVSRAERNG